MSFASLLLKYLIIGPKKFQPYKYLLKNRTGLFYFLTPLLVHPKISTGLFYFLTHPISASPKLVQAYSILKTNYLRSKCADSMDPITFSILEFVMSGPLNRINITSSELSCLDTIKTPLPRAPLSS